MRSRFKTPRAAKDETTWSLVGGDGGDEDGEDGEDDGQRVAELLQPLQGEAAMGGQGEPMGARTRPGARDQAPPLWPSTRPHIQPPSFSTRSKSPTTLGLGLKPFLASH